MAIRYALLRLKAIVCKELIHMRHLYLAYLLSTIIPFFQVLVFGFIINTDPRHLPTVVIDNDHSSFVQNILTGLKNTSYFQIVGTVENEKEAAEMLQTGKAVFVVNIPPSFSRDLIRGLHPHILIEADATDPVSLGGAYQAANALVPSMFSRNFQGSLDYLLPQKDSFSFDLHSKYNPALIVQYHSLPGLLAIVLTTILAPMIASVMASEYEEGTFETLLITPAKPLDIILGKLVPNFLVGYGIYFLVITVSHYIFHVPFHGSFILLTILAAPFISATLGVGLVASTFSKTQQEAVAYANLYTLPAMLLSGFTFPFLGMPKFAQTISNMLPTTHFTRIIYNVMLKNTDFATIWSDTWPILLFLGLVIGLCVVLYRKTLD